MSATRHVNIHPSDHLPSLLQKHMFDVIVIGGGPAGRTAAYRTANAGLTTLIIENELVGGECPFWACVPSKALLRPAEALSIARTMSGAKELIINGPNGEVVDPSGVFYRRDRLVREYKDDFFVNLSEKQNCVVVRGRGMIAGEKTVSVSNDTAGEDIMLRASQAVIVATGSEPVIPDIPGLSDIGYWIPRDATSAQHAPQHLIILGGGVVGCEMATFYAQLSKVTLLCSTPTILPRLESEASKRVESSLKSNGVTVLCNIKVGRFDRAGNGLKAFLSNGQSVEGTRLLIATGRKPKNDGIGFDTLNFSHADNLIVNDSLQIQGHDWLYALGDSNMRNPTTHFGEYQARAAALTIIAKSRGQSPQPIPYGDFSATADHDCVTQVIATNPAVACAGLTLSQAKSRGLNVKEIIVGFNFPGAWLQTEFGYDGWAQWVIDTDQHVLVGATFVGTGVGDLLHASTVAIVGQVPVPRLWHAVASFPTMSEIYSSLLAASGY